MLITCGGIVAGGRKGLPGVPRPFSVTAPAGVVGRCDAKVPEDCDVDAKASEISLLYDVESLSWW